ncbi:uncharacterized protein BO66DRAFT_34866 [Aspergillus aculeatinus CBS 121060]|uniref:Uncharacterized protein n=1 Tax=Aspergillus aculeatinus CBS 121060 TaxID=1448322 RepID=A0ACD1HFY4_9EURO|nr:hypothetical protein BO66DRAFT_34866 [Aspergillus aculeatinus CBS 121060]RAH72391.1 hypothetical protein BO66DRAFT_34866 [Aspergillus aculeatinus CBS 121060]
MASERTINSKTPTPYESTRTVEAGAKKPSIDDAPLLAERNGTFKEVMNERQSNDESNSGTHGKAGDGMNFSRETQQSDQTTKTTTASADLSDERQSEQRSTGAKFEKREHAPSSMQADTVKSSSEHAPEHTSKKQKTKEQHVAVKDELSAPSVTKSSQPANDPKTSAGRPKKRKDAPNRDIPTDGIGSRTRSRTKIAS